jgi:hypothetical protein
MGYNARNDEIRDNVTRCDASGKHNAEHWQPFADSPRHFPPKAMCGSGRRLPPPLHQNIPGSLSTATVAAPWLT